MSKEKVLILGGSFDPVHKGHSYILDFCSKELNIEKCFYLINYKSPLKNLSQTPNYHRLEMLKLHCLNDGFGILDIEIKSNKTSYTYQTMKNLKEDHPNWEIYFIIGNDNVAILDKWYEINKLTQIVNFVGCKRPNTEIKNPLNIQMLENDLVEISSTQFRETKNKNLIYNNVYEYIKKHQLY